MGSVKLLNKPFKAFILYALLILGCSIPVYYWVVDSIWLDELDEHNKNIKEKIEKKLSLLSPEEFNRVIGQWNTFQLDTTLQPLERSSQKKDSIYTISKSNPNSDEKEPERYRRLSSYLHFHGKTYLLNVETNVEETSETMSAISMVTFAFFVVLLIGFYLLNRRLSKSIWAPFYKTLDQLKRFDLSQGKNLHFTSTDIEEFQDLHVVLHKLIAKNISTYQQQKTFIENASHELQTPIAVLKSKLDLLLQNQDLTENQSQRISGLCLPLSRLTRINKNLLLLAKIDNQQFSEIETLDLSSVLKESVEMLNDFMKTKEIFYQLNLHSAIQLNCNPVLLEILINNLLINAIIHNQKHGKLIIVCNKNQLHISNSGDQALDSALMFKRFSKPSQSNSSNGLGLAIVKEICDKYHWDISYSFQSGMHSFRIEF